MNVSFERNTILREVEAVSIELKAIAVSVSPVAAERKVTTNFDVRSTSNIDYLVEVSFKLTIISWNSTKLKTF